MATGPSTTQTPYLVASLPNVTFTSLLSAGEQVGFRADGVPARFVGVPDGIGVVPVGDGTIIVTVNHEITNTDGIRREHGSIGAFVERLVINTNTNAVLSSQDLAKTVFQDNDGDGVYVNQTTAWSRFCSGDLAAQSAFFNSATGLGTPDRIYLTAEESGNEGRAFAFIVTGSSAGQAIELPALGNLSFENAVANPFTGNKTVVMLDDDTSPGGQVYMYVGDKQAAGTVVDRAGLNNGQLYGVKVAGLLDEVSGSFLPNDKSTFTMIQVPNAKTMTGAQIQTSSESLGITEFFRPEDGAWDPSHPNWYYFVTTASVTENSKLWRLEFTDINNPTAGGTISMLLRGDEGHRMLDNLTVTTDGKVFTVEDVGNNPRVGKVWYYDPITDKLTEIGSEDPARFTPPSPPFNQDEEASGIIDVTSTYGNANLKVFLLDVQAHNVFGGEIVEGGQLDLMYVHNTAVEPRADFNADGDSGILFRQTNGNVRVDELNASQFQSTQTLGNVGNEWTLFGPGDFDNDGFADVMFRRTTDGALRFDTIQNGSLKTTMMGQVGTEWTLRGTGDFDGDGDRDLFWQKSDGSIRIDLQQNGVITSGNSRVIGQVGTNFTSSGTGDFDGDGDSDLLWRGNDGTVRIDKIQNGQYVSTQSQGGVGLEWTIAGTGDFDHNNVSDIVFRRADGTVRIDPINGTSLASRTIGQVGNEWQIASTGDYDKDGDSDLLWRKADGTVRVDIFENGQLINTLIEGQVGNEWQII